MPTVAEEIDEMEAEPVDQLAGDEAPVAEAGPGFDWFGWLKSPTGEGPVEAYVDHPMNVLKDLTGARILRGLTGLFGALNFAVVDILWGGFEYLQRRGRPNGNA